MIDRISLTVLTSMNLMFLKTNQWLLYILRLPKVSLSTSDNKLHHHHHHQSKSLLYEKDIFNAIIYKDTGYYE